MNPAVRIAILGVSFFALFMFLGLQLWAVQVTATENFEAQAESNQVRVVETPAPRGQILDREGRVLAGTRPALAAVVDGALLPEEDDPDYPDLIQRVSAFAGVPVADVAELFVDARRRSDRLILVADLSEDQAVRLVEYKDDFAGLSLLPQPVRVYPEGEIGADILGYIGPPNEADVERPDIGPNDTVGKVGVERQYDDDLRGIPGAIKFRVNSAREVIEVFNEEPPQAGGNLQLTVDADLQEVLQESLADGLELARSTYGDPECVPSDDRACPVRAVGVVLDPRDGAVLAMGSAPTYDPNQFVDGVTQEEWDRLSSLAVLNNFAIQGEYAPASAFKAVASILAMEEEIFPRGANSPEDQYFCVGRLEFAFTDGSQQVFRDWAADGHGDVDLSRALETSCDLYFWEVALSIWENRVREDGTGTYDEGLLQKWAREFGFDEDTGIDLPYEKDGLIPDREWFTRAQRETPGLVRTGPWTGGDVMNSVIGQGSVLSTPLQLANAYAAMVNGGTLWRPRVVDSVVDQQGNVIRENTPTVLNEIDLAPGTVTAFRRDLQNVVNGPTGTARSAFEEFGNGVISVGGKTGTAEIIKGETAAEDVDTAVFVGVAPINAPEYVVVVFVERGGSGGSIAAPTGRRIMQYLMNGRRGMTPIVAGEELD